VTPVEHLGRALQAVEAELSDLEHRAGFIRAAIEAFGLDADGLLLDLCKADAGIIEVGGIIEGVDDLDTMLGGDDDQPFLSYSDAAVVYRNGKRWDWDAIAALIGRIDAGGERRVAGLVHELDVSEATAQWMVKRCRELSLIDLERPSFSEQGARERAAAGAFYQ